MTDEERLSAWLSGDLDDNAERELVARLDAEPDLQRHLDEMTHLIADLDALPLLGAPPPLVHPRVNPPHLTASRGLHPVWLLLCAAAGALATLALSQPTPATLTVANTIVRTSGAVELTPTPEDPNMDWTHAASAAVGGLLTLTVTAGTADVTGPDGATTTLSAGDSVPVVAPRSPGPTRLVEVSPTPAPVASPSERPAPHRETRPGGADELERLRFENELLRGQLSLIQGEAIAWPDNVAASISPENFEQSLLGALPTDSVYQLDGVDCSEYPCIGFLVGTGLDEDHGRADIDALNDALRNLEGASRISMSHGVSENSGGSATSVVAVAIAGEGADPNLAQRVDFRSESGMRDRLEDLSAEAAEAP